MEFAYLEKHNPWWKGKQEIESDFHIAQWKSKTYKWEPGLLNEISIDPGSIHIINGPRQVGKTTAMKLFIRRLLEKGTKESNIFYLRCDELNSVEDLHTAFDIYDSFKEPEGVRFIFLDEISNVSNWYGFIKNMHDNGELRETIILITGSNSIDIRKSAEYLPGRRGKGKDFLMLPLSFRSFIEVIDQKTAKGIPLLSNLSEDEICSKSKKGYSYWKEIEKLFRKYMECGGFPRPLEEYMSKGSISHEVDDIYLSWFKGDVFKSGRSDVIAKQIIKTILEKVPSAMSWENISSDIEVKSPKTVASYVELFADLYVLSILYHIDPDKKTTNFAKNKKIHFIDPYIVRLFEHWCLFDDKVKGEVLAETITAVSLMRFAFSQSGLEKRINENSFYWSNGYEIDIVINYNGQLLGFEVKWGRVQERSKRIGKIKDYVYLTKDEFSFNNQLIIPLPLFLAMLPEKIEK